MAGGTLVRDRETEGAATGNVLYHAGELFPAELAIAFDIDLREITPATSPTNSELLSRWIDEKESTHTRTMLDAIVAGGSEEGSALVVTRAYEGAFYYLRELQRLGAAKLPMLHMFDLISSDEEQFRRYNLHQLRELFELMCRVTRREPGQEQLEAAIEARNRRRAQLRALHEARLERRVSGTQAIHFLLGDGQGYAPDNSSQSHPKTALLVTNEPIHDDKLHVTLEQHGLCVIAEDDGTGRFGCPGDLEHDGDILAAIARHYGAIPTIRTPDRDARLAFVQTVLHGGVDVVVCLFGKEDHQLGWDLPYLRTQVEAAGASFVAAPLAGPERLAERLARL